MEAPGMIFDLLAHPGSVSGGDIEPLPLTWGKRGSPFSSARSSSPLMNLGSQASSASAILFVPSMEHRVLLSLRQGLCASTPAVFRVTPVSGTS